jgi:hypothetical protein
MHTCCSTHIELITGQAQHVVSNNEARSCNHCCSGKSVSITHAVCEFAALGIQHAMCMGHIVNRGLPRSTTFFHITSQRHDFL